jgi:hypothetical protein
LLPNSNLQDKKQIKIDAVIPKITNIQLRHDAESENEYQGLTYLREGRYVEVELTINKNVSVQGTPEFNFNNKFYLPFTSVKNYGDETRLIFNKKDSINDIKSLYSVCETDDDKTVMSNLYSILSRAVNCHIENFKYLKQALLDLHEAYELYYRTQGNALLDANEILRWWDSEKYGYAD